MSVAIKYIWYIGLEFLNFCTVILADYKRDQKRGAVEDQMPVYLSKILANTCLIEPEMRRTRKRRNSDCGRKF